MNTRTPIITLYQPWIFWVTLGWKTIETRLHPKFASLAGKTIGLHAGIKYDEDAFASAMKYLTPHQVEISRNFLRLGGAIVATAYVKEHRKLNASDSQAALINCAENDRWGLILTDVTIIPAIPIAGKQGIWYANIPITK